jgi:hypothetical protein
MRYADSPTVVVSTEVRAPAAAVWALVSDINIAARFSPEFLGAEWLDADPGPGARFVGRSRHDVIGEWSTTSYVSRYEPERAFAWDVSDPLHPSASWWFELDPQPAGVQLRHGARIGPGPSGLTPAITAMPEKEDRIIARRLAEFEANMTATVEGIRALAEGDR